MSLHRIAVVCAAFVVLGFSAGGIRAAGQVASRDDALLAEVRGLRVAIERLAGVGPRAQLMIGRLQLQEQRVNTLIARVAQQRDRIHPVEREIGDLQRRATDLQTSLDSPRSEERRQVEDELRIVQRHLAVQTAELRRLQAEEAEVAGQLATEQAHWIDLNRQLEQLDAALRK